jgi:hypothetical protein
VLGAQAAAHPARARISHASRARSVMKAGRLSDCLSR